VTVPGDEPRRPGVYARLAEEAETHRVALTPPGWVRWLGRAICVAIALAVLAAALQVHPW
jgi:hypothetical protein